jgi:CubicO group peptidase (beta-lactamase class C family)
MTSDAIPRGTPSFAPGMGYGLGVSVLADPTRNGNLGWPGDYGWSGYATTTFIVDPHERMVAMIFAQRLPGDGHFLDEFRTLVFQALLD